MVRTPAFLALGIVVVVALLLGSALGADLGSATGVGSAAGPAPAGTAGPTLLGAPGNSLLAPTAGAATPSATSYYSASVTTAALRDAQATPWTFWGVNVAAVQQFTKTDASSVAQTPVNFLRYPGGLLGEELNFTSDVVTNNNGATQKASTSVAAFVAACRSIGCHAIVQLPVEIDQPQTAAYYARYVVHTLGFQPAYWELGNAAPGYKHFGVPWSKWGRERGEGMNPTLFADTVARYITAVKAVDSGARFLAFGSGMGATDYAKQWIEEIVAVDGHRLSGISLHSYYIGSVPKDPTWSDLFANLNGYYSLPKQMAADRGFIRDTCATCHLKVFVTEANAAENNRYDSLLSTFAGTLYLAADATQALNLRINNVDWFCYDAHYPGAWRVDNHYQMQYTLFAKMLTQLKGKVVPSTVSGPSTFYAVATYGFSGLALLMVNLATGKYVNVDLAKAGFVLGSKVDVSQWVNGASHPESTTRTLRDTLSLPPLSITVLSVGRSGVVGAAAPVVGPLVGPNGTSQAAAPTSGGLFGSVGPTPVVVGGLGAPLALPSGPGVVVERILRTPA
jgi:hypothetical protein